MAISIIITIIVSSIVFATESEKIEIEKTVAYAEGFLREYYQNEYSDVTDVSRYEIDEGLKTYLKYKVDALKTNREVYGKIKEYKLRLENISSTQIGEDTVVDIVAHIEFKYPDSNEITKVGEKVSVIVGKESCSYIIKDFYSSGNIFDIIVRGKNIVLWEISNGAKIIKVPDFEKIVNCAKNQNKLIKKAADNIKIALKEDFCGKIESDVPSKGSGQTDYLFNTSTAKSYANANAIKQYPDPGSSLAPNYMDFGIYGGDCTNFVSHCLLAGGSCMNIGSNDATHWYYLGSGNRSATWSSVKWLHNFINNTQMLSGPNGVVNAHFTIQESFYDVVGRIVVIQIKYPNAINWGHSTIQVAKQKSSEMSTIMMPRITSRSSYGNYHVSEILSVAYPYDPLDINNPNYCTFRTLQINGYNS